LHRSKAVPGSLTRSTLRSGAETTPRWQRGEIRTRQGTGNLLGNAEPNPLQLSSGDRLNLWDLFAQSGELHYATVLRPDGTHEIVAVNPLAEGTSGYWTSPNTGKRYGTRWTVNIPALDASLTVVAQPQGQELQWGEGHPGPFVHGAPFPRPHWRSNHDWPVTWQVWLFSVSVPCDARLGSE
jgi:Lipocalin-like domain